MDVKTSQPPQLVNSKPSVFHGPSQAHSALYLSSHYHQQPGMNPHLTAMHPSLPRNIAPKPNNQMPVTVSIANMAVSPPPPLQISPPLHQHLTMQQHQPLAMQQPLGSQLPMQVQSALHSPTMQQVSLYASVLCTSGGLGAGRAVYQAEEARVVFLLKWRKNCGHLTDLHLEKVTYKWSVVRITIPGADSPSIQITGFFPKTYQLGVPLPLTPLFLVSVSLVTTCAKMPYVPWILLKPSVISF